MLQQFTLTKEDYLEHLLYTASKSKVIKQNRFKDWLIRSGTIFLIGLAFYLGGSKFMAFFLAVFALLALIFYPFYQQKWYKNHYKKYVDDIKNDNVDTNEIELTPEYVLTKDKTGESKMNTSEVVEINEIGKYFFMKFSTNQSLILPKHSFNYELLYSELSQIAGLNNIIINKELEWKWK